MRFVEKKFNNCRFTKLIQNYDKVTEMWQIAARGDRGKRQEDEFLVCLRIANDIDVLCFLHHFNG